MQNLYDFVYKNRKGDSFVVLKNDEILEYTRTDIGLYFRAVRNGSAETVNVYIVRNGGQFPKTRFYGPEENYESNTGLNKEQVRAKFHKANK